MGFDITVLSLDTAVSIEDGNLSADAVSWRSLDELYDAGVVAFTLAGSPCETFSEARFTPCTTPSGKPGPRPLRSADRVWGLTGLTRRERRQLDIGSRLHLQTLYLLTLQWMEGGGFLSEHPAQQRDPTRPTTWNTPIMEMVRSLPDVHLKTVLQYHWGATAVKPTGSLFGRVGRLANNLYKWADMDLPKPKEVLIGRTDDGLGYRTAAAKEYPERLGAGMAQVAADFLNSRWKGQSIRVVRATLSTDATEWFSRAKTASSIIRGSQYQPDYQPQRGGA